MSVDFYFIFVFFKLTLYDSVRKVHISGPVNNFPLHLFNFCFSYMPLEVVTTAVTVVDGKRRGEDVITAIVYLNHPQEQVWKMSCHGNMERQIGTNHRKCTKGTMETENNLI